MAQKKTLIWRLQDFSGGQVSAINPKAIAKNELAKAYDVCIDQRGMLQSRPRWSWFNKAQVDLGMQHPKQGIYTFWDRDCREWLFLVGLDSTDWLKIKGTLANQMTFSSGGGTVDKWLIAEDSAFAEDWSYYWYPRSFASYQGDLIITHARYHGMLILRLHHNWIDDDIGLTGGTGNKGYQMFSWPIMAHVATTYQNSLVLANTPMGQNFMHWSDPELPISDQFYVLPGGAWTGYKPEHDIFNPETHKGAHWKNVYPNEGDGIMALKEWYGMLGIFRKHSLLVGDVNRNVKKVHEGYGTISPNTVVTTPYGWVFIDYEGKGVFLWNGTSKPPIKISEPIDDEWQTMNVTPPVELASKLWASKTAFAEDGDDGTGGINAGLTDLAWNDAVDGLDIDVGEEEGYWVSNIMTTEQAYVTWLNIRPEVSFDEGISNEAYIKIYARSGATHAACEDAGNAFVLMGEIVPPTDTGDPYCKMEWFAGYPWRLGGPDRLTIASDESHKFVQLRLHLHRNAADEVAILSPILSSVRLNYVHGDDPTTDFGRFPNLHWDGKRLWVNVWDGNTDIKYTNRTYVWDASRIPAGGTGRWMRWKNVNSACMTQFDRRTLWVTSHRLLANHDLRFTDQNEYDPQIVADPVVNPHVETAYWDGGDPCRLKHLDSLRIAWKDVGTGNLMILITTQRPPITLTYDADGNPVLTDPSPPSKFFYLVIPLTNTGRDRVWNAGIQDMQLGYSGGRLGWTKSGTGEQHMEYSQGYAFKIEIMNDWFSDPAMPYDDDTYYPAAPLEFILNSIELRATIMGDEKPGDEPHHAP